MTNMLKRTSLLAVLGLCILLTLAACNRSEAPESTPTRTPRPTFTPTPEGQIPNSQLFETPVSVAEAPTTDPNILPTDTASPTPTETPISTPTPEATPTPIPAVLFANDVVNVRSGPGTSYNRVGTLNSGQRYTITGKNAAGSWWQIDFDGRSAWVIDTLVQKEGQIDTVQVAANIPAAPQQQPQQPRPQPTATPVPQPTAPPKPRYEFNVALVQACRRQPAGNWFEGTVYKNGQPFNGARVVFSYSPDGPLVTPAQISGPHPGYENWRAGYYSHIINASSPTAGNWYVWIVDANGTRISDMANFQTTGPGDGCNEAVVDFDSR